MKSILYSEQKNYLNKFLTVGDKLLTEMEAYAEKFNIPILNKDAASFLEQLIIIKKPKLVLELGTGIAYSSIRIARCLIGDGILYSIEKSKSNIAIAKKNIANSGVKNKIIILEGEAIQILPSLGKKFDFIFLDSDKKDYESLFKISFKILKKNGIIFIDNLLWHGYAASKKVPLNYKNSTEIIRNFNKLFSEYPGLKTSILPIGDGIGLGIKLPPKAYKKYE